jgi:hypothetical protein
MSQDEEPRLGPRKLPVTCGHCSSRNHYRREELVPSPVCSSCQKPLSGPELEAAVNQLTVKAAIEASK